MMSEAGLYDRPVLVIDPGMHTAPISRMDVNGTRGIAVTGSTDGTVRVWDIADGTLRRTIRIPRGPGNAGKVAAVAVSPDGALIAAGGWMTQTAKAEDVCLFDTETGLMRQRIGAFPNVVYHLAFSPDGTRLAVSLAGGNGVRLFDGNKG